MSLTPTQRRARSYFFAKRVTQFRRFRSQPPSYTDLRTLFADATILAANYRSSGTTDGKYELAASIEPHF